ncbi:MAG TPA: trypsin-like serine protease [Pseudolabrys sp.]|nr:trypsin-like serine protease [Pseudolabrys sp.]
MNLRAAVRVASLSCLLAMAAGPLRAGQPDNRLKSAGETIVSASEYPWSAVGKLNNGVSGSCSAVLISQDYALTAAHCLFFRNTGRFLPPESLHLLLGYENQTYAQHLRIRAYFIPPSYDPLKPFESIANDWALLQVSGESRGRARPVRVAQQTQPSETRVMTAGYSGRTPFKMTADTGCSLIGRSSDRALLFDSCAAPHGFSGGPVLVKAADQRSVSVLGIHVGNQAWETRPFAIAVSAEKIWPEIRACLEQHRCRFQHIAGRRDPSAAEILARPSAGSANAVADSTDPACGDIESLLCGVPFAERN